MADWRDVRADRVLDLQDQGFLVEEGRPGTPGFLYARSFLVRAESIGGPTRQQWDAAGGLPADSRPDESAPELAGLGVQLHRYLGHAHLPTLVRDLQDRLVDAGADRSIGHVALNYGITGVPIYKGGPSTAPTPTTDHWAVDPDWGTGPAAVVVLDTGLANRERLGVVIDVDTDPGKDDEDALMPPGAAPGPLLASEAGHGSFVAALIHRYAPGVRIAVERVLNPDGFGTEAEVANALAGLAAKYPDVQVVNLSLGTYDDADFFEPMGLSVALAALPSNIAVVAAAGNDHNPLNPWYPAAFSRVIGVAAVELSGNAFVPTSFSNSGPSADVCTFGHDILSAYVHGDFVEDAALPPTPHTSGWARWSGTSFASPLVAAELARRSGPNLTGQAAWDGPNGLKKELLPLGKANTPEAAYGLLYDPRDPRNNAGPLPTQP